MNDDLNKPGTFRLHVFGEQGDLTDEEYRARKQHLMDEISMESRTAAKYIPDDLSEPVERVSEEVYLARRKQLLEASVDRIDVLSQLRKMEFNANLPVAVKNEIPLYRPMPIRILGETEARLMSNAANFRGDRVWKRACHTSERRDKKALQKKPHTSSTPSTVGDVSKVQPKHFPHGTFVHAHKGRKVKRGNPYRRRR